MWGAGVMTSCSDDPIVVTPPDKEPPDMIDTMKVKVIQGDTIRLLPPPEGKIYHAAFPNLGGTEDAVSTTKIQGFENLVMKDIGWVYFSNNFFSSIRFPKSEVNRIRLNNKTPFIRLMARTDFTTGAVDPNYSMESFINGDHDEALKKWAQEAKKIDGPLLAEFGTEINGNWFPWNAEFNGGASRGYGDPNQYDGTERFKKVYRHIIDICRAEGVNNITWFFHVNAYSGPDEAWNRMKDYYPGDDYIDWIGVSIYGPQNQQSGWWSLEKVLDDTWDEISSIATEEKPIALLEWGTIDYPDLGSKADWITEALETLSPGGKYAGQIKAISYWHETFGDTNLKIDSSPEALQAYKAGIAGEQFISELNFEN